MSAAPVLPPIRALIVDDSGFMRIALRKIIEADGDIRVVGEARNGREAIRLAQELKPDVVTMDIVMPEVDGIEATRRIRALPAPKNAVPIIAVTAGAMAGEIQRCLDAGMNDYVGKPINPDQLIQVILRTLGPEAAAAGDGDAPAPEPASDVGARLAEGDETLDEAVLSTLEEQLGREMVVELVEEYRTSATDLARRIDAARATGNLDELGDAAHTLKSSSGSLGLKRLYRQAFTVEESAREGRADASVEASAIGDMVADGLARLDARYSAAAGA